jgi:hypothetical protein
MHWYTIALFLHVTGAISLFVAYGTLLFGTAALRRATRVEEVRAIARPLVAGRRIGRENVSVIGAVGTGGAVLLIVTGLGMALSGWSLRLGWIEVAIAGVALVAPLGPFVIGPRLDAIASAADQVPDGPLPVALDARIHDPLLVTALQAGAAILLGIVFLMTNKPTLVDSSIALAAALVIGLGSALPHWRARADRALAGRRAARRGHADAGSAP